MRIEDLCEEWRKRYSCALTYPISPEDAKAKSRNSNLWFGQFCLVCERELSHKSAGPHFRGKSHLRKFQTYPLKATYERVDPIFMPADQYKFAETSKEHKKPFPQFEFGRIHCRPPTFLKEIGFKQGGPAMRILVLGDFDMTFSLGLQRATQTNSRKHTIVCAPCKIASDDYRINRNMNQCGSAGIEVLKEVKLFDPDGLKFEDPFDRVFVLFPRVSFLTNLADPLNSRFLQDLFRVINKNSVIRPDGYLSILMKRREFVDWDTCTVALQEKLFLQRAVFHQTGMLQPFEPRQPAGDAQSKAKRLNGVKSPLYYIFARTREQGMLGLNPWIKTENKPQTAPIDDADAVLQKLEKHFIKKEVKEEK